ncbi:MAG: DNA replication/repair protein RecF [Myxococcota bacterium]
MLLEALRLRHFRNLSAVDLEPHPRFNILHGENGQGKTNLLEAVYLLSAVKSFRPQTNKDLIEWGEDRAVLEARVDRGGSERIVKLEISERGKKVFLNDSPVRQLADFFGTVNIVMFGPEDIVILKGSPSERRRFIDRAIFNARPAYATEHQHYEDVLQQRNSLLKEPELDESLLSVYDEQLVQYGADVISRRLTFLEHFKPVLRRVFKQIFRQDFEAEIAYDMKWSDREIDLDALGTKADIERVLQAGLERTRDDERHRGYTLIGPHRDDLTASLNGRDVKTYASQGQHRAFVLAMKIAEITYLEERYHFAPILLLDDVSSELDRQRNRHLFDFLRSREDGQVFITTTHRDYILLEDDVRSFAVDGGQIRVSQD